MKCKTKHPIIIQEVYDSIRIKKLNQLPKFDLKLNSSKPISPYSNSIYANLYTNSNKSNGSIKSSGSGKKLIISERIIPYQLNVEQSTCSFSTITRVSSSNSSSSSSPTNNSSSSSCWSNSDHYFDSFMEEDDEKLKNETNGDLNEEDVDFLLSNTGFNLEQIKKWHSEFKEKCEACRIEYDQFKLYYKTLLPNHMSQTSRENLIRKLFNLFDLDADGYLNFAEFLVSFWVRFKAPVREKFTWLFNMYDSDRNGSLNYTEMRNALRLSLNNSDLDLLLNTLKKDYRNLVEKDIKNKKIYEEIFSEEISYFSGENSNSNNSSDEELPFLLNNNSKRLGQDSSRIDRKLNQVIHLLDLICKREHKSKNASIYEDEYDDSSLCTDSFLDLLNASRLSESAYDSRRSSYYNSSEFFYKNSVEYVKYVSNSKSRLMRKINFNRESFLFLCVKYKLLRKILLPIECFYENSNLIKQFF
jgi:Ca2+-binding EF-hand superfamily protein